MADISPAWHQAFDTIKRRAEGLGKNPFDHPSDFFGAIDLIGRAAQAERTAPNEDAVRDFFVDAGWSKDDATRISDWPQVAVGAVKARA